MLSTLRSTIPQRRIELKEDFYEDNYSIDFKQNELLIIRSINKPVKFLVENESAFKRLFSFGPRYFPESFLTSDCLVKIWLFQHFTHYKTLYQPC